MGPEHLSIAGGLQWSVCLAMPRVGQLRAGRQVMWPATPPARVGFFTQLESGQGQPGHGWGLRRLSRAMRRVDGATCANPCVTAAPAPWMLDGTLRPSCQAELRPRALRVSRAPVPSSTGLSLGWEGRAGGAGLRSGAGQGSRGARLLGAWGGVRPPHPTALPQAASVRSARAFLGPARGSGACCPLASLPAAGGTGPRAAQSPSDARSAADVRTRAWTARSALLALVCAGRVSQGAEAGGGGWPAGSGSAPLDCCVLEARDGFAAFSGERDHHVVTLQPHFSVTLQSLG